MSDEQVPVEKLTYEQARDELKVVIQNLEGGNAPLEQTLELWQRGEDLAKKCKDILEQAQKKINEVTAPDAAQ